MTLVYISNKNVTTLASKNLNSAARIPDGTDINAVDGTDVRILPRSNPQSEVHISVNKYRPSNIMVSFQTTFGLGNSNQGYSITDNGGVSWSGAETLPNGAGGRGDPSTSFDADGNGYLVTMGPNSTSNSPDGYLVQKTTDFGSTWQTQTRGVGPVANFDKEMIATDNMVTSPYKNNFYCAWTDFNSPNSVKFNRSTNGTSSFSTPITLRNNLGQGTNVQTGVNGQVYVCWANYSTGNLPADGIGFSYSSDGGVNFTTNIPFSYSGTRNVSIGDPNYNNTRVNDFPSMAVDKSCSQFRGRIYIAYPAKENGNGKSVIQVRSSSDNGTTWGDAVTVSISNGRQNWFPWIAVDDATGVVSMVYYSLDETTGFNTNTYVAYSSDGGVNFNNIKVSDASHVTAPIPGFGGGYAGDYIGITSYAGKAYAVWGDSRNGTWQIYFSTITYDAPVIFSSLSTLNIRGNVTYTSNDKNVKYESTGEIVLASNSTLNIESSSNVKMVSGTRIRLGPGFHAKAGSTFRASIGTIASCDGNSNARKEDNFKDSTITIGDIDLSVFPNPTLNTVTFEYISQKDENIIIMVSDIVGKTYFERVIDKSIKGINQINIDMKELPTGTFIYTFKTTNRIKSGKILKLN